VQWKHRNDSERLLEEPAAADHMSSCSIGQTASRLEPFGQQAAPDRRPLMKKIFLSATLLAALSTPALAAYSKAQSEMNPRGHVVSEPHRHRSSGMLPHRIERGEFNDPYWTPCDYSTDWGPDSCG
jgi:hypothetical protein